MNRQVHLRPRAEEDIDGQFVYIAKHSSKAALRFLAQVRSTIGRLAESPGLGIRYSSIHPRLTNVLVWKVDRFPNHLLFYRQTEKGIEVLRVLHGARDIEALFDTGEIEGPRN